VRAQVTPYGIPLGTELRAAICKWSVPDVAENEGPWEACGSMSRDIQLFATAFLRSKAPSIDAFLAQQPQFSPCWKAAIALEIIKMLACLTLVMPQEIGTRTLGTICKARVAAKGLRNNMLKLVTFNVDRSVECALFQAIKNTCRLHDESSLWEGKC
jgi:hypothetical protein